MKLPRKPLHAASIIAGCMVIGGPSAQATLLPEADPFVNAVPFGDFVSYSLNALCEGDNGNVNCNGSPFKVSAGNLKQDLGIWLDAGGQQDNSEFGSGSDADDAYPSNSGLTSFSTATTADPSPDITGDMATTWDVRLDPLRSFLGSSALVFLFNHNETAGGEAGGLADPNDLLAYAEVMLLDEAVSPTDPLKFFFTGDKTSAENNGAPLETTDVNDSRWALADGNFCIEENTGNLVSLNAADCTDTSDDGTGTVVVTSNIGGNIMFNAVFSETLDAAVRGSSTFDIMKVNLVFRSMNNGPEQIIISNDFQVVSIPQPATLGLFGVALTFAGLACAARRRRTA